MKHEILLGLTTTPNSDWKEKVNEMKKFGIKKIALFPTFLKINKRKELYDLLDEIDGLEIPHVHLRSHDMESWEMEWFEKKGARYFNIHMGNLECEAFKNYKDKIFVENHIFRAIPEDQLKNSGGICIDYQHYEFAKRIRRSVANKTVQYLEQYKIGCAHLSPFPKLKYKLIRLFRRLGDHYMISLDELDYMKNNKKYLPKYISLEMENSFQRQLEAKAYLEKLLQL